MRLICVLSCLALQAEYVAGTPIKENEKEQNRGVDNGLLENETKVLLPPLVFPDDPKKYKILPPNNLTALKILRHQIEATNSSTQEATSLSEAYTTSEKSVLHEQGEVPNDDLEEDDFKFEVESVQEDDYSKHSMELEESFRHSNRRVKIDEVFSENIETLDSGKLKHGHVAAISVTVIIAIGLVIYAVLIVWRNYLEKRYGMRERLVDHDECEIDADGTQLNANRLRL